MGLFSKFRKFTGNDFPETLKTKPRHLLHLKELSREILKGNTVALARAITLCESQKPSDRKYADALLQQLLLRTGQSLRVGITGSPGWAKVPSLKRLENSSLHWERK